MDTHAAILLSLFSSGMIFMLLIYMLARSFQPEGHHFRKYGLYLAAILLSCVTQDYMRFFFRSTQACCDGTRELVSIVILGQLLAYILYFSFVSGFLALRDTLKGVYRLFQFTTLVCWMTIVLYLILVFIFQHGRWANMLSDGIRFYLILVSLYSLLMSFKLHSPNVRYFILGNGIYLLLAIMAWVPYLIDQGYIPDTPIKVLFNNLQPAVIAESICFALGLNATMLQYEKEKTNQQKTLILELEASRQSQDQLQDLLQQRANLQAQALARAHQEQLEVKKRMAIENERNRISRDMHDDLGSSVSAIHLLSRHVYEKAAIYPPEIRDELATIMHSSEVLTQRMREMIWTLNMKDDHLASLLQFIQRLIHSLQEKYPTPLTLILPDMIPSWRVTQVQRKNVFICSREILTILLHEDSTSHIQVKIHVGEATMVDIQFDFWCTSPGVPSLLVQKEKILLEPFRSLMSRFGGELEIGHQTSPTTIHLRFQAENKAYPVSNIIADNP